MNGIATIFPETSECF